jgi:hypothetical protein
LLNPEKEGPFNIKILPRESIMPITYKLADRTLKIAKSTKKKDRSTSKHSPGSLSCQSPMNWQIGCRRLLNPEKEGQFNVKILPRKFIMPITYNTSNSYYNISVTAFRQLILIYPGCLNADLPNMVKLTNQITLVK